MLFFVYKKVLDRVLSEVLGCKGMVTKHGLNDQLPEEIRTLFGPQAPHLYVYPMPGTQCTFSLPVSKGKVFCDRAAEEAKLAGLWHEWRATAATAGE